MFLSLVLSLLIALRCLFFFKYPELREIKETFLTFAADASFMTGAGSGVYGLFRSWEGASVAWDYVSRKWEKCSFFIPIEK